MLYILSKINDDDDDDDDDDVDDDDITSICNSQCLAR